MESYILLKVADNFYCYNVNSVQRVIDFPNVVPFPDSKYFVDGIINYEPEIGKSIALKAVNFRKLVSAQTLEKQILDVVCGVSNNKNMVDILMKIYPKLSSNVSLYSSLGFVLQNIQQSCADEAKLKSSREIIKKNIQMILSKYQKCIVVQEKAEPFALCVDEIERILYLDDDQIHKKNNIDDNLIKIKGIAEIENKLVYVIDSIGI